MATTTNPKHPVDLDTEPLQRDTPAPWIGPLVIAFFVFGLILFVVVVLVVFP